MVQQRDWELILALIYTLPQFKVDTPSHTHQLRGLTYDLVLDFLLIGTSIASFLLGSLLCPLLCLVLQQCHQRLSELFVSFH